MEEKDKIALAQDWVRKLANGINPLTGNAVNEDDVVNNVHISRCLFYVADLLGKYTERRPRSNSSRIIPFMASAVQKEKYNYVEAISISAFAREIEKLIPEDMKALGYSLMTNWLVQKGLLTESEPNTNGRTYKVATAKGEEIGIYSEERENEGRGRYLITLYNREAQRFLLEHLEEISHVH
jgi:galactokinase/mevalonate kinase-like predicted kinase